jgi:glucan phosphoethanolaminetransferase (alkaline phosphatase superfamily)
LYSIIGSIPPARIEPIYNIQETLCILIILFLVVASIIEIKLWSKILLSLFALAIAIIHYYLLHLVSAYEGVVLLPFIVIETGRNNYAALSIDYGQLLILFIILVWRKELYRLTRFILEKVRGRKSDTH